MCKKLLKTALPIAASILAPYALPGISATLASAIGSGFGTLAAGGKPLQALGAGIGTYAGGNLFGGAGNVGPGGTIAASLGKAGLSSVANALPAEMAGASLSEAMGSFVGSNMGANFGEALSGPASTKQAGPSPFAPSRKESGNLPPSLSQFSGMSPEQTSTGIATQGVYGGGVGKDEQEYFMNLINNRLMDTNSMSSLAPIETGYLDQMGIKGDDPYQVMKRMSQYQF